MPTHNPPTDEELDIPPPSKRRASNNPGILAFLKRNALLILGVGSVIAFWVTLYAWLIYKPHYSASTVVIIKDSAITSKYVEPEKQYALQTTSSSSSNPVLNTMSLLKSSKISDALWQYMQKEQPGELKKMHIKTHRQWESFFQDGSAFIKSKNQPGTDLISIKFSWSNGVIAKEGLDTVVKAFQISSRDLNKAADSSRMKFLNRQTGEIEESLRRIRHEKTELRSKLGLISMVREQDDLAASRLELTNRLNQIESQANGRENQVSFYKSTLGLNPKQAVAGTAVGQNSTLIRLQDEQYRLKELYSVLHASLTDTNPKVREVKAQLSQIQNDINAEKSRVLASGNNVKAAVADETRGKAVLAMLTAQGEANDLRAQASALRNRLTQIRSEISQYPGYAEQISNIEQRENSLSIALDQLRQKVIEARIQEEQTLSNVFVLDESRLPEKPQFPTELHLSIIGLVLGLGTGTAVAFAREKLMNRPGDVPPTGPNAPTPPKGTWLETINDDDADDSVDERVLEPAGHVRRVPARTGYLRTSGLFPRISKPRRDAGSLAPVQAVEQPVSQPKLSIVPDPVAVVAPVVTIPEPLSEADLQQQWQQIIEETVHEPVLAKPVELALPQLEATKTDSTEALHVSPAISKPASYETKPSLLSSRWSQYDMSSLPSFFAEPGFDLSAPLPVATANPVPTKAPAGSIGKRLLSAFSSLRPNHVLTAQVNWPQTASQKETPVSLAALAQQSITLKQG